MTWPQVSGAAEHCALAIAPPEPTAVSLEPLSPAVTWDRRLAQAISTVGSPPAVAVLAIASTATAASLATGEVFVAWGWAVAYLLLAIVAPFLYLMRLVQRGAVTDLDMQRREQRPRPLLAAIAATGMGWLMLQIGGAPLPLRALACGAWGELVLILAITLRWKISIHCATAAGLAVLLWGMFNVSPALTCAAVAAIAWSRWRLRRHTWAQTAAGTALGGAVYWVALAAYLW